MRVSDDLRDDVSTFLAWSRTADHCQMAGLYEFMAHEVEVAPKASMLEMTEEDYLLAEMKLHRFAESPVVTSWRAIATSRRAWKRDIRESRQWWALGELVMATTLAYCSLAVRSIVPTWQPTYAEAYCRAHR